MPPEQEAQESDDSPIPSGRWHGFYVYRHSPARHRMDLGLEFRGGKIAGDGVDDIGRFAIRGFYELDSLRCRWTKTYLGAHSVSYEGAWDMGSIWGIWTLAHSRGGFRIWPLGQGEALALEEYEAIPSEVEEDLVVGPRRAGPGEQPFE